MKYILSFILLLSLNKASELSIGSMMPEMGHRMKNINGKNLTLSDAKGDVGTLVIFSCNTCPWVIKWEDRYVCLLYTSPSPRDQRGSRMPSSA